MIYAIAAAVLAAIWWWSLKAAAIQDEFRASREWDEFTEGGERMFRE